MGGIGDSREQKEGTGNSRGQAGSRTFWGGGDRKRDRSLWETEQEKKQEIVGTISPQLLAEENHFSK